MYSESSVHFDKAIELTGYGRFHYETFTVCALCIISVGFQNGLSAYIFPAAQCELKLTSFEMSLLNISFLVGGVVSSFLWGTLADFKGRRKILIFTHFSNIILTTIFVTNNSVFSLIACRFSNGFLIGAPGSIIFSYLAEFQPPKYRSSVICFSGIFFTSAWLLLPVLAYLILPLQINFQFLFLQITSWRLFMLILLLPEIVVTFWFMRLPESPKFLIAKNETRQALQVLKKMFVVNTGKDVKEYPVKVLLVDVVRSENGSVPCRGTTVKVVQEMWTLFKSLFVSPLLKRTVLIVTIMFLNMFGVFGLGWWLPELFVRFERFQSLHPNKTITIKELAILNDIKTSCKPSFDNSVIQSTVIMGVASILANAVSGFCAQKVPLKVIPLVTMLVGGLSASSIYWLTSSWQNLLVASIFQASMVTANMTIGGVVVELFPTNVGALAICLTMCAGRLGAISSNLVFGFLMDKHCEIPIFVVAVGVIIGAGLCFVLPNNATNHEKEKSIRH